MHAKEIVQRFCAAHMSAMHQARCRVFAAAVAAAMVGHCLSLTRLARGLSACGAHKSALKRIDRWVGHGRIHDEARLVGAVLLRLLSGMGPSLVIAVDWSAASPGGTFVELRAVVTRLGMGRGVTVYQRVYACKQLGNAKAERELLETLHAWLPPGTAVTVVADAGFRGPWFKQIERLGWTYIGRVRRPIHVSRDGREYFPATDCFAHATGKATRWTDCCLNKQPRTWWCDLVLVRRQHRGGRSYRCLGHGSTATATRRAKVSAREPWLLAHSPSLRTHYRPDEIVALYALRMQIEENFRDSKSVVFGMGFEIGRSRSAGRLHALLLIATVAAFLLWHIGQLAETEGLHQRFRTTTRHTRELSIVTLALMLCALSSGIPMTLHARRALELRLRMRP